MIYYIFRHGETYYTKNGLHYGENYLTAEIIPEAVPVIENLAHYLEDKLSDHNFTSPFPRTIQTSDIVKKITGKNFVIDERIREEGLSRAEESLEQMEKRLSDFIEFTKNSNFETVGVCTHGWPIAVLQALLMKGNVNKADLGNYPRCGQLLIIDNKIVKIMDFN